MPSAPRYSIGTWDSEQQAYTPQTDDLNRWINVDWQGLLRALRELKNEWGEDPYRVRFADGSRDSDWRTLVERTDGKTLPEILEQWQR